MLKFPLHHKFEYIFLHELKYKIKLVVILDDFVQSNDVGMMKFLKHFDFVEINAFFPVWVLLFHYFDGYNLFGLFVDGLDDRSETAITKGFA